MTESKEVFDEYLNPPLTVQNIDRYVVRSSILRSLQSQLPSFSGRFLDVGSGNQPYRSLLTNEPSRVTEYVPLDLLDNKQYQEAEFTWDGRTMPFEDDSFDCAMATEVLEHCPEPEITMKEVSRVLKPGGTFFFTVPFIWPLHDCPFDEYRYTPWSLQRHLSNSGFSEINVWPTGGWDAALAQTIGLWAMRSPMPEKKRKWASRIAFPIIKWLIKHDKAADSFGHGFYLMPGIAGTAKTTPKAP